MSVDNARALVTMGDLAPSFSKDVHIQAVVIEGGEATTLHPEEQGTKQLFVNRSKIPKEKWRPALMEENWVVLCQAVNQSIKEKEWKEMHDELTEVSKKIGV